MMLAEAPTPRQLRPVRPSHDVVPVPEPVEHVPALYNTLLHLCRLTETFEHNNEKIPYIHIYSRPVESGLEFITAKESGFEGISCIDDVARAAVLAYHVYERTGDERALTLANGWMRYILYMQEPDGRFTNFIKDTQGTKNTDGITSKTGGEWWTARALWALATAYKVTGQQHYLKAFNDGYRKPDPETTHVMKIRAVHVLALLELHQRQPSDDLKNHIRDLCDSIVASGPGYFRDGPDETEVAMWGYHQLEAVARAAELFAESDPRTSKRYIAACEATVENLIEHDVEAGFYHVFPTKQDIDQCAYSVSTLTTGLAALYRVTENSVYWHLAQGCVAWLDDRNPAEKPVYDHKTGACKDGVTKEHVSGNLGAESAIEAGFMELAACDLAAMHAWLNKQHSTRAERLVVVSRAEKPTSSGRAVDRSPGQPAAPYNDMSAR